MLRIAEGGRNSLSLCKTKTVSWERFIAALSSPRRDRETLKQFSKLPKEEQNRLKGADGWVVGGPVEGKRRSRATVHFREIIAFDLDEISPDILDEIRSGLSPICRFEFILHSTRKHTKKAPRVRLWLIAERPIPTEIYEPVTRILAQMVDPSMDGVDPVSFRASQLMFLPTLCKDSEWIFEHNPGAAVDHKTVLDEFDGDYRDWSQLPYSHKRTEARRRAEKSENPLEKEGVIGAFCQTFDVEEAIAEFIPDVYQPGDSSGEQPRYTYLDGSGANGARVYDDGLFLYSDHDTDPAGKLNANAFDLVRIHKFGELDEEVDTTEVSPGKWPSFKAMSEFARKLPGVREKLVETRYAGVSEDFFDDDDEEADEDDQDDGDTDDLIGDREPPKTDGLPSKRPAPPPKPKKGWMARDLDLDENGYIKNTPTNIRKLVQNDPRIRGRVAYNELVGGPVLRRDLKLKVTGLRDFVVEDRVNGDEWTDIHDIAIRDMFSERMGEFSGFAMKPAREDIRDAIRIIADQWRFNPVTEYLETLPEWDGVDRPIYPNYLGTADDAYHREAGRLVLLASIARAYNPGHEFQAVPIMVGKQGTGKSSFVVSLYGREWSGELTVDLKSNADAVQQMEGMWGMEFPEIANMRRSENDDAKMFVTLQKDKIRKPYAARPETFWRRVVFHGTTNNSKFLKDPTGNRRWWPIVVGRAMVDNPGIRRDRDQIWAQAMAEYLALCEDHGYRHIPLRLSREADLQAKLVQGAHEEEMSEKVLAGQIQSWLETPRPAEEFGLDVADQKRARLAARFDDEGDGPRELWAVPTKVCAKMIDLEAGLNLRDSDSLKPRKIGTAMEFVSGWNTHASSLRFAPPYGTQRAWVRADASKAEISRGYRIVSISEDGGSDLV